MSESAKSVTLSHAAFRAVKEAFPSISLKAVEYRGQSTLIVEPKDLLSVMTFLKNDPRCAFGFLSDIGCVDYLNYPAPQPGGFAVVYNLISFTNDTRFFVKAYVDPTMPTDGAAVDPGLVLESVTSLWPGAEWMEREVYDMYGIRFRNHPDLRRILTWKDFPAHPLRKDYPLRGRGEREHYQKLARDSA